MPDPTLTLLTPDLRDSFFDMVREFQSAGEDRYDWVVKRFATEFDSYLQFLDEQSRGINLPPNHVPQTSYWLIDDERRILGGSRLRHRVNSVLREWGCNIGYDVRPSERRKGRGTLLLSLMLDKAREIGLKQVFLTCDSTNIGSIGIIRKNNGQLDDEYFLERVGVIVRRYAIEL